MNFINQNNDMIQNMIQNMFMNNNNIDYIFPNDNVIKEINKYLDNSEIFKDLYRDIYPYIKTDKRTIIFINLKNEHKKVLVPINIRKSELYGSSNEFKINKYSDLKLYHNGKLLDNDDSTINCILSGDCIQIIEDLNIDSYFINHFLKNMKIEKYFI